MPGAKVVKPGQGVRGGRPRAALAAALVLGLVVAGCQPSSYQYRWDFFFDSILRPDGLIVRGVLLTLVISVASQTIGVALGVVGALGKMAKAPWFRVPAGFYVWFFRGTPLLVQISLIFYGLGVTGIYRWSDFAPAGDFGKAGVQAGILALGINEGAYMSEIVRAGILSIDPGQMEAAKSLGMTFAQAMRRIILPQAARVIVPPLGNEFNNMLKTTSLLVIISVPELYVTFSYKNANGPTVFHPFELFLAAAAWYLLLTTGWGLIQAQIERRLGRGFGGERPPGILDRLLSGWRAPAEPFPVTGGR